MAKKKNDINTEYNGASIDVLEGLEAVRVRPGMYIGSTNSKGLHHCIWEVLDNSIDEAIAGFCDNICLTINKNNSISIEDNGRGIPVDNHPKLNIPTVRVIYTVLHAGGKFKQGVYKNSGGLHGVGASVVNALSSWVEVEVYRDKKIYIDRYENGGKPVTKLDKDGLLPSIGKTDKQGSKITFLPDSTIFETTEWKKDLITQKLKEMSYLNKGIRITFKDEKTKEEIVFYEERGLLGFIDELTDDKNNITPSIYIEGKSNDIEAEIVFRLSEEFGETIISYCNNISTTEGGTHVTGFKGGLTRLINNYAKELGYKLTFDGKDIRNGITAIVSLKHCNPMYEGQTKTKLGNTDAKGAVEDIINKEGQIFFDRNYNTLKAIIDNAEKMYKLKQKEDVEKTNIPSKNDFGLSGKLASATSKNAEECEIYMVEGDSAGGTAKKGRNRKYQAILPLRGKILNVEKQNIVKVLSSDEIRKMIGAFGCNYGENINLKDLNYHKIIILTDADVDGYHIRTLLLTFLYRYMRELILNGYIYIALPPLYYVEYLLKGKKITEYLYDDMALDKLRKSGAKINALQRYKGLGEMNADQLGETVFDTATRQIVQVTIDDALLAEETTQLLMGSKVEPRKKLIIKEAKNAHIDM